LLEQERVTELRDVGVAAAAAQLREQRGRVARQGVATVLRVQVDLAEREAPLDAEGIGVPVEVALQIVIGRLGRRGDVVRDELHLLPEPLADDGVVAVEPERQRLAVVRFLAHPVPNQSVQLVRRRRALVSALVAGREVLDLSRRDHDLPRLRAAVLAHEASHHEEPGSQ